MKIFTIYIANVPFDDSDQSKFQPALLIDIGENTAVVYKITSKYQNKSDTVKDFYYPIMNWKDTHLRKPNYVDVHKTYRLPQSIVFKHQLIGMLSEYDVIALFDFANNYLNKLDKD
ncbi:hypothetical protein OF389_11340 [Companilactobacillus farciminis]|nr:hypothetical protein [Companilactobacillus farciminis]